MATEGAVESKFVDRVLPCKECNKDWTFTVGEQEFYAEKEFENDPVRCKDCRKAQKMKRRQQYQERRAAGGRRAPKADGEAPKPRGVCYAFQKGECERGDACRFLHEKEEA